MDSRSIPASSQKIHDAHPMSYLLALVQHLSPFTVPARIAVGLGTVYSSNKDTFTHKMQAFWEHLQHALTIYKVKVNTNKVIFMVE